MTARLFLLREMYYTDDGEGRTTEHEEIHYDRGYFTFGGTGQDICNQYNKAVMDKYHTDQGRIAAQETALDQEIAVWTQQQQALEKAGLPLMHPNSKPKRKNSYGAPNEPQSFEGWAHIIQMSTGYYWWDLVEIEPAKEAEGAE